MFENIKLLALDFDGVLTDNKVIVDENGIESVVCNRSDGLGLEMVRKRGIEVVVISKEKNKVVSSRSRKLNIPYIQGADNKIKILKKEIINRKLNKEEVCFVGNDINDLECIKYVGVGVAVADAYPEVKNTAKYVTKKRGGEGAVREVCDMLLKGA